MFSETPDKNNHRADLLEKRRKMTLPTSANALTTIFTKSNEDFGVRRKTSTSKEKECSVNKTGCILERTTSDKGTDKCISETNLETAANQEEYRESAECSESNNESNEEKTNHSLVERTFENSVMSKLNKEDGRLECDGQLDENSGAFIGNAPLTLSGSCKKGTEDKDNIEQNRTSNVNSTNEGNVCQSAILTVSLVSEMYSDTDSDSSK